MAVDPQSALDQPFARPSATALNRLLATLEVKVVFLSECLVSPGLAASAAEPCRAGPPLQPGGGRGPAERRKGKTVVRLRP